ncbi:polyphosphate polymerase domain-containing protein [Oribacterium sp. WCC10]|uniref:polyphosphate polymerase domain-containing protein n=1 Tax=Oribacterium sp. WCC10 TaxID=1855343 RepID=UPI0008E05458|nr:polyphosphate polymerase domain-containing protein [Oribacterium sp. WCC10]SFG75104.1 VTC domain-containing protein [Oribacterium sp. WCC10]
MLDVSRKELKYMIGTDEVYYLRKRIERLMEADSNNDLYGYTVRSLYFDTWKDNDYQEKLDGLNNRKKIRMRIYNGSRDYIKLELKAKEGDFQRKRSLKLNVDEAERMIDEDYTFLLERPEGFAHGLYTMISTKGYRPKCIVEYDRIAYMNEFNDIRVTFDMRLRALEDPYEFFSGNIEAYPVADSSETTLEVKYNGFLFSYIKHALDLVDRPRISNSKYVRARAFLR